MRNGGNTPTQSDHAAPLDTEIQFAGTGEHRHDGPETVNALTMKMNLFVGADHKSRRLKKSKR